jgi:hypothetical protein
MPHETATNSHNGQKMEMPGLGNSSGDVIMQKGGRHRRSGRRRSMRKMSMRRKSAGRRKTGRRR